MKTQLISPLMKIRMSPAQLEAGRVLPVRVDAERNLRRFPRD